ncbi:MAG: AbrB/MazE/SpoVT family DNA-binding domain-containing protein [Nitrospirales bacterium]|nr:AbrB/MazE/SpoVT family DNA-binding domain-containing protein [Nitrospirales bacterium]
MSATLSSKGQITIPKRIRETLKIKEGDAVDFVLENGDVKLKGIPRGRAKALAGSLRHFAKGKSDSKNIREITRRKVAIATAKEATAR